MIKYFNSFLFYKWNKSSDSVKNIKKSVNFLELSILIALYVLVMGLNYFFNYLSGVYNYVFFQNAEQALIFQILGMVVLYLLFFLYLGYYFSKLFFKVNMSLSSFMKYQLYLVLPLLFLLVVISILNYLTALVSEYFSFLSFIVILVFFFYFFKYISTALNFFSKEFKTSRKSIGVVVFLWGFIVFVGVSILIALLLVFIGFSSV